jgi:phosphomannomutase
VVQVGCGPTPMVYFASHHLKAAAAIMVTGSHNPPDYNGFKMVLAQCPFYDQDITDLGKEVALQLGKEMLHISRKVTNMAEEISQAYIAVLLEAIHYWGDARIKVAWDPGNGAAGDILARLILQLPGEHVVINGAIDGTFPAHHPDPSVAANMQQLQALVLAEKCDIGIAFDGDADRIGVVDHLGRILPGDQLVAWFATLVSKAEKDPKIIVDVKVSDVVVETIRNHGGNPLIWKTGHSHLKAKMAEIDAAFGGEMSGHIFFRDRYYGFDDALYAAMRLMDGLLQGAPSIAQFRDSFARTVDTGELRLEYDDTKKFPLIAALAAWCGKRGLAYVDIDGVRVSSPHGFWLVRASNTQAAISVRCEAKDEAGFTLLKAELDQAMQDCDGPQLEV